MKKGDKSMKTKELIRESEKEKWTEHVANKMFQSFMQFQNPFSLSKDYLEHIRRDLRNAYDDPLKRSFMEASYL